MLSDGEEFDAETIVWTAGVKANPVLARTDLPLDDKGRLRCRADLRVEGVDGAWSRGRRRGGARPHRRRRGHVPARARSTPSGRRRCSATTSPCVLHGRSPNAYAHKHVGSVASLGLHKGVAQVYGVKLRGFPAWFMHRTYHVSRVPTLQPQGPGRPRLDAGAVLPPRRRLARLAAAAARGVQRGDPVTSGRVRSRSR